MINKDDLIILEGGPYLRYAIPLDYPPSSVKEPRYGYSHKKMQIIDSWFEQHNDSYKSFLQFMHSQKIEHIDHSYDKNAGSIAYWIGGPITSFDLLALYSMIVKYKPKKYIEIGSGTTTFWARQAINDMQLKSKIISIDPHPRREVSGVCDESIRYNLETIKEEDLSMFDHLEKNDILFIDGSHRAFMNSDVTIFFIDILPRLKPGVLVHFHDIFLPLDYPPVYQTRYWNEQYMLAVYFMNAQHAVIPLLPTWYITRSNFFQQYFPQPRIDFLCDMHNDSWKYGGSMWFTKK